MKITSLNLKILKNIAFVVGIPFVASVTLFTMKDYTSQEKAEVVPDKTNTTYCWYVPLLGWKCDKFDDIY